MYKIYAVRKNNSSCNYQNPCLRGCFSCYNDLLFIFVQNHTVLFGFFIQHLFF